MSTTLLDFVTRASLSLGGEPITSLEDGTREAQVFAAVWQAELETCLTLGNWQFASRDFNLSRISTAPDDPNYQYQFTLPADFLAVRYAMDERGNQISDWTIQGGVLLSNRDAVRLKYVRRFTEAELFRLPAWFGDLWVAKLSHRAAEALTGKSTIREQARAEFETCLIRARTKDAREGGTPRAAIAPSNWARARMGV